MIRSIKIKEILTSKEELDKILKRVMNTFDSNRLAGKTLELTIKIEVGDEYEMDHRNMDADK